MLLYNGHQTLIERQPSHPSGYGRISRVAMAVTVPVLEASPVVGTAAGSFGCLQEILQKARPSFQVKIIHVSHFDMDFTDELRTECFPVTL
jgi:hypothetical protein